MTPVEKSVQAKWIEVSKRFMSSPPMSRLADQSISMDHYAIYLRETYFYTREDPQLQAMCTGFFRGEQRGLVRMFLRHAVSEVGHEKLALDDLRSLGYNADSIAEEEPLPDTIAFSAFPHYAIVHRSPISYLAYLYFLEFLLTQMGRGIVDMLRSVGVGESSMIFLAEHRSVDVAHNDLMRKYISAMVRFPHELREFEYCLGVVGRLFENLLAGGFDAVDRGYRVRKRHLVAEAVS